VSTPLDYEPPIVSSRRTYAWASLLSAALFCASALPLIAPDLHNHLEPILLAPWLALGISALIFRQVAAQHGRSHPNAAFQQRRAVTILIVSGALIGGWGAAGKIFGEDPHNFVRGQVKCASNLKQIGLAMMLYANENGGVYPNAVDQLVTFHSEYISDIFCCPQASDTPATGPTTQAVAANLMAGGHLSYVYLGNGFTNAASVDAVLAHETPGHHRGGGMNVLFGDLHVEFISERQAKALLAELQAGFNPPRPPTLRILAGGSISGEN